MWPIFGGFSVDTYFLVLFRHVLPQKFKYASATKVADFWRIIMWIHVRFVYFSIS